MTTLRLVYCACSSLIEQRPLARCGKIFGWPYTPHGGRPLCCFSSYFLGEASLPVSLCPSSTIQTPTPLPTLFVAEHKGAVILGLLVAMATAHGDSSPHIHYPTLPSSGPSGSGNSPVLLAWHHLVPS